MKASALFLVVVGFWLIATPLTFETLDPTIFTSDMICGFLLTILGLIAFFCPSHFFFFAFFLIGLWLNLAPLVFWAPSGMEYLNDTVTGLLTMLFAFEFLPHLKKGNGSVPLGWSFNPSTWTYRIPLIFLAVICWFLARYLTGFQLGYYQTPWDPLFHQGTLKVLNSTISQDFPISDAGLGALAYSLEAIFCWIGSESRWKTAPWLVLTFGILALPVSIVSIILILLQPLAVGAWCFLCLCIAFLMLFTVMVGAIEVAATLQGMRRAKVNGKSYGRSLIFGFEEQK